MNLKYWFVGVVLLPLSLSWSFAAPATHELNPEPSSYPIPDAIFNTAYSHARHTGFPDHLRVGSMLIRLEETQLSQLIKAYPALQEGWSGDAGDSEVWVCFAVSTPQGKLLVWPSSGEMGGGNIVTGIDIAEASLALTAHCPEIMQGQVMGTLGVPVWLGMSKAHVIALMGQPSAIYRDYFVYAYSKPFIPADKNWGPCETDASITIQFESGQIDRLWVDRLSSC